MLCSAGAADMTSHHMHVTGVMSISRLESGRGEGGAVLSINTCALLRLLPGKRSKCLLRG